MAKKQYAIARTVDVNSQFILDEVVAIFGYNVLSDGWKDGIPTEASL